jgi:hypothetical protein
MNLSDPVESSDVEETRLTRVSRFWSEVFVHAFGIGALALFGGLVFKLLQWML